MSGLTRRSFEYPTAGPDQGQAEHSRVEIQLISGESSLDPHCKPDRERKQSAASSNRSQTFVNTAARRWRIRPEAGADGADGAV